MSSAAWRRHTVEKTHSSRNLKECPMVAIDLEPATKQLAELVVGVPDELLGQPTPCADTSVGDLVDHIAGLSVAFTAAATKTTPEERAKKARADAANLDPDWRDQIPRDLASLAQAWVDPAAWEGMTEAGGIEMPGEVAALVALDEVVIHAWDLARATGQPFACDDESLQAVHGFVLQFSSPEMAEQRKGLFGPVFDVPDDAPLLDRVVGLTGRDPAWSPSPGS